MDKLYLLVSKDKEWYESVDSCLRLWISKDKKDIEGNISGKRLTNITEVKDKRLPDMIGQEFLEKYKELPYVGGTRSEETNQMVFKNVNECYLMMCVRNYFFGGF